MDYYYDLLLNFEEEYYMFYEWDESDNIEYIKKIPIFHVDSKCMEELFSSKIKVEEDFLKSIENKTKLKQKDFLKYSSIFSDGKNTLALEFNDSGEVINKSSIILDDEININEFMYNISICKINYTVLSKEIIKKETRQELKVKKILRMEIENMYKNKNYSKLKYIYLEWFNKLIDNIDEMYNNMLKSLENSLTEKEYNIYELIKLSYNNV